MAREAEWTGPDSPAVNDTIWLYRIAGIARLVLVGVAGFAAGGLADERWTNAFLRDLADRRERVEVIDYNAAIHFAAHFTFRHGVPYIIVLLTATAIGALYLLLRQAPESSDRRTQRRWPWPPNWLITPSVLLLSAVAGGLTNRLLTAREFSRNMSQFSKDAVLDPWHADMAFYADAAVVVGGGLFVIWGSWLLIGRLVTRDTTV